MVYGPLNDDQFAEHANKEGGGSLLLSQRAALVSGTGHDSGYAVGYPGHNVQRTGPATGAQVRAHRQGIERDSEFMNHPFGQPLQGVWAPHGGNRTELDAAQLVKDRGFAAAMGRQRGETAIRSIHGNHDIYLSEKAPPPRVSRDNGVDVLHHSYRNGNAQLGWDEATKPTGIKYYGQPHIHPAFKAPARPPVRP